MQRVYFSELAGVRQLNGLLKIRNTAALSAGLENPLGLVECIRKVLTIADRQTAWFFTVHILARFSCQHGRLRMPSVARGDDHSVNVFSGKQLTKVAKQHAVFVSVMAIDQRLACVSTRRLHIRDRHTPDIIKF